MCHDTLTRTEWFPENIMPVYSGYYERFDGVGVVVDYYDGTKWKEDKTSSHPFHKAICWLPWQGLTELYIICNCCKELKSGAQFGKRSGKLKAHWCRAVFRSNCKVCEVKLEELRCITKKEKQMENEKVSCVGCKQEEIMHEIFTVNVKRVDSERVYSTYPPFTNREVACEFQKLIQKSVRDPELRVCVDAQRVYNSLDQLQDKFFEVLSSGKVPCDR